jgi:hypothetical protein
MQETAMMHLRDKCLEVCKEIQKERSLPDRAYHSAMQNIAKDIDAQMLVIEKQQIMDAFNQGYREAEPEPLMGNDVSKFSDAENYWQRTYGTNEPTAAS